ncbi:MAG: DUF1328 family protein [Halapricum sp.]
MRPSQSRRSRCSSGEGSFELAVLFFILALVPAVLGARGVAGLSMDIANWFVIIFVLLAVVTFIL